MRFLDLRRFKWIGDVEKFWDSGILEFYIEFVMLFNNFCGFMNKVVVNGNGFVINDFVYYWFYYIFIMVLVDYFIMFWILFKIIGYVGICFGY